MRVLQFKTNEDYEKWSNDNEVFDVIDCNGKMIGQILGPDADELVKYNIAHIMMKYGEVRLDKELTDVQMEELKKNRLVRTIVTGNILRMDDNQRLIVKRLRSLFQEAKDAGLYVLTNDDKNGLYLLNGRFFDGISNEDGLSGKWVETENGHKFVPYTEGEKSNYVKIDTDVDCEFIEGNKYIDFMNWGCCVLPWYGHLKP